MAAEVRIVPRYRAGDGANVRSSYDSSIHAEVPAGTIAYGAQRYVTWVGTIVWDYDVEGFTGPGFRGTQLGGAWERIEDGPRCGCGELPCDAFDAYTERVARQGYAVPPHTEPIVGIPDVFPASQRGLLPDGTLTKLGTIEGRSLTAYKIAGEYVAFDRIHEPQPMAEIMVTFG